jgi:hypothetical protein
LLGAEKNIQGPSEKPYDALNMVLVPQLKILIENKVVSFDSNNCHFIKYFITIVLFVDL